MKLKVTPTALKGWFQYRCERKFVYETMDRELYNQIPIHEQAVNSAWMDEGNDYERRIVAEVEARDPGSVLVPRGVDNGSLTTAASRRFLQRLDPRRRFAHQLLLVSTPTLATRLRLAEDLEVRSGKVDLVEVLEGEGPPQFRVIDIKATQVATLFHKAQVAFYALMLEATLAEFGIPGELADEGQIWHRTAPGGARWEVESFQVRGYMRLVEDFFQQRALELTRFQVVPKGPDTTPFHVYFKCEQCKFLGHCQRQIGDDLTPDKLDLSAIAGVTQQSKRTLNGLGIRTVGDLLQREGELRGQDDWGLRTRGTALIRRAKALSKGEVLRLEGQYSLQMPPRVDRPIYLLADRDPVDGRLATLGCLVVRAEGLEVYHVRVIANEAQEAGALIEILGVVLEALLEVDQWNEQHGQTQPLHTHIFTYEPAEAADLRDAIGRHLDQPRIREGLLDLVRIFPPDQVMPEPDYQGYHHLPASSLRNILTDLYAFPVKVSHDLRRVSHALRDSGNDLGMTYDPAPNFARPFSSRLSIELCRRLSDPAEQGPISADMRQRLATMHALASWLYRQNSAVSSGEEFLRLRKKPFRFRQQFNPLGAGDLDVLQAQGLLASRTALFQALLELARPSQQRRDRLNCYADMTLMSQVVDRRGNLYLTFHVPEASRLSELTASELGLILSDGSPDLILNPENWPALQASLLPPVERTGVGLINVKIWSSAAELGVIPALLKKPGTRWFLDKAFVDLNSSKLVNFLTFLAGGN